jgi:hypothetical protein
MATEIEPLICLSVARIQKVEWLTAFIKAYEKALSSQNILSGFRGTGIHPFKPVKVLNCITHPSSQPQIQPSTPPLLTTPFNDMVLTSSPANFNAVHDVNVARKREI